MKYHISVKFIAIFLASLALLSVLGSAAGIICLTSANLYSQSVDELYDEQMESIRRTFAVNLAHRYASLTLGNCPESYLDQYFGNNWLYDTFQYGLYFYTIKDEAGNIVESTLEYPLPDADRYTIQVTDIRYRSVISGLTSESSLENTQSTEATLSPEEYAASISGTPETTAPPEVHWDGYWNYNTDTYVQFAYQYTHLPPHTVDLYLLPGAMPEEHLWSMIRIVWQYRIELFYVLGGGLLVLAILAVYLCCAAGKRPKSDEIHPAGLNCVPLDLYGGFCAGMIILIIGFGWEALEFLLRENPQVSAPFLLLAGYTCSLLFVGFFYACAAQFKAPRGYWWRHSAIGFLLLRLWRAVRWAGRSIHALVTMMPVIWQWLLTAFVMALTVAVTLILSIAASGFMQLFFIAAFIACLIGCILVICYGGFCFGLLMKGAQKMAEGDLNHVVPIRYLVGSFRDFAIRLNALAGAAQIAAERQLKSERMKTELITNVSHDIKTPLTSIINYVDLLQKPHSQQEEAAYLEVLSRQSQRMKKLIEDLMDMSKASTGNMQVDIDRIDAAEVINQALGEFSDKLAAAQLVPVFRAPENPVIILADGRLMWRVMNNLLSNTVKYALPGTRVYLDLEQIENRAVISLKNISREELNVSAEELLERFVRGDTSRNTEGSGLGLNIAQSLMELQHGQLQLLVDGDLFKVTLSFPIGG